MEITIIGNVQLADERLNLIVSGLAPFAVCRVDLCMKYSWSECPQRSYAYYRADVDGRIDLEKVKPFKGRYKTINSMGLFATTRSDLGDFTIRKERDFTREYIVCTFQATCGKDRAERKLT